MNTNKNKKFKEQANNQKTSEKMVVEDDEDMFDIENLREVV